MLDDRLREQMLGDMGITVWRSRRTAVAQPARLGDAGTPRESTAPRESAAPPAAVPPRAAAALGEARRAVAARRDPGSAPVPEASAMPAPAVTGSAHAVDEPSFTVTSFALPGAVLVLPGDPSKRELRLALDLLAAASGRWTDQPALRSFRWPPDTPAPPATARARPAARALRAFVDKDLEDYAAAVLLCPRELLQQMAESRRGPEPLVFESLRALSRDADAKRALWDAIRRLRATHSAADPTG